MVSKHFCGIGVPLARAGLLPFIGSTDRHLVLSPCILGTGSWLGYCLLPPVDLATRHHPLRWLSTEPADRRSLGQLRPDNSDDLVGQRNRRDLARPALQ